MSVRGNKADIFDFARGIADLIGWFTGSSPSSPSETPKPAFSENCFGPDHLYFIKSRNVQSGKVEIHQTDYSTRYQKITAHILTGLDPNAECLYQISNRELYAVWVPPKEGVKGIGGNYDAGKVWTVQYPQSSNYASPSGDWTTPPGLTAELGRGNIIVVDFGSRDLIGFDIVYWNEDEKYMDPDWIKNPKTVAVLRNGTWGYFVPSPRNRGNFDPADRSKGSWNIYEGQLYFVKICDTESGMVEVHGGPYLDNKPFKCITRFSTADADKGLWKIGTFGNLYFIKTSSTGSGKVELQIALRSHEYKAISPVIVTEIDCNDATNGDFYLSRGFTRQFEFLLAAKAAGFPQGGGGRYHRKPYTPLEKFSFNINEDPSPLSRVWLKDFLQ